MEQEQAEPITLEGPLSSTANHHTNLTIPGSCALAARPMRHLSAEPVPFSWRLGRVHGHHSSPVRTVKRAKGGIIRGICSCEPMQSCCVFCLKDFFEEGGLILRLCSCSVMPFCCDPVIRPWWCRAFDAISGVIRRPLARPCPVLLFSCNPVRRRRRQSSPRGGRDDGTGSSVPPFPLYRFVVAPS